MRKLTAQGHEVAEIDWSWGGRPVEQYLDVPPFRDEPHLKMALGGFETTSIGLIVRKKRADLI